LGWGIFENVKLFSLKLFSLKLFSLKLFSLKLFSLKLFSSPPPARTLGAAPPLFGFAQAEQSSAEGGPDAEDPPGVRGSPGRGDQNTAHYARVEGESTKGAPGQKPGDRYTEDPPGVRGSPGRGESSTAHDARVEGESTKGAPSQKSGDRYTEEATATVAPAGGDINVSGSFEGIRRYPPTPPHPASSSQVLRNSFASSSQVLRKFFATNV
jgi:hypothetical protein